MTTIKRDEIVQKLREIADRLEASPIESKDTPYECYGHTPSGLHYTVYFWQQERPGKDGQ